MSHGAEANQHDDIVLEVQEDQLDALHEQTQLLREIRHHTNFMYQVLIVYVTLTVSALVLGVLALGVFNR